jgi:sec-independent protein translocase protein TatC
VALPAVVRRKGRDPRSPRPADGRMSLSDHLRELRSRLGWSVLAIAVAMVVAFLLWEPIFEFLKQPYCDTAAGARQDCVLTSFSVFDQFKVRLRVSAIGGVLLAAPVWLYQIGAFITPALHRKERKYAAGFLAVSLVLFAAGTVVAYLTISEGLDFLLRIGGGEIQAITGVQAYLDFVTLVLIAFGLAFEFPVLVSFLNMVGIFPLAQMRSWRRGMIVAIFAVSAAITPSQDPFTFVLMALPVCLLYEGCILIARVRQRSARRRSAADPVASLDDDETSLLETGAGDPDAAGRPGDGTASRL